MDRSALHCPNRFARSAILTISALAFALALRTTAGACTAPRSIASPVVSAPIRALPKTPDVLISPRSTPADPPPAEDAEETVLEALRDLARWLYSRLQSEYDHLTSDEATEEGIIINEYTFTAGGRRFG